ncbi:MAG TPA: BTAD domain-containing putative transcriptional regulator, partial [Gaiellaceae bacterium]|nr:BTAD domain-containing putative transcriptional regulator [Gaiellaceae bacterium]
PPQTAANALQVAVHGLRKLLGRDRIVSRGAGYLLRVAPEELDLLQFEALVEKARGERPTVAAQTLRLALSLWRGRPLADLAEAPFAAIEAGRLEEERLAALERRLEADLALGRADELVGELESLIAEHPFREGLRARLMLALYRAGRQAEALEAYREARELLVEELGVEPGDELRRLEQAILRQDPALAPPPRPPKGNLPAPPTPLVGRELELAAVTGLLRSPDVRLVTLTGTGGTGKTRLALEVARELAADLPDGAVLVDLAPLAEPEEVVPTVARTLAVAESRGSTLESLKEALRDRGLLLFLDNFERVDDAAPVVSELLAAAPGVKALVTSRAVLRLSGEYEYPLPPLRVPDREERRRLDVLARNEAVALFLSRAQAARHDFRLSAETAEPVADICVALDGLPLALELAAARCRQLSVHDVAAGLEERLELLTGGPRDAPARQQTLRATIAWSYELLTPAEQRLLAELGVFAGGCTLEAAAAVCRATAEALEALAGQSLLQRDEHDGDLRLRMLETVRAYALEQLEASGAGDVARHRHADHFRALAEEAGAALWASVQGPDRAVWLERLDRDYENMRAALAWAGGKDPETQLRLAAGLIEFWIDRAYLEEGRGWLGQALAGSNNSASPLRAKALHGASYLAGAQGDYAPCEALGRESLEAYRALGDQEGAGRTLHLLAQVADARGDPERALPLAEQSLALARELGHERGVIVSLRHLGSLARQAGEAERAATLLEEARELARSLGDASALAHVCTDLGALALAGGDGETASRLARESAGLHKGIGNTAGLASSVHLLGLIAEQEGRAERAARLFGAAESLRETAGSVLHSSGEADYRAAAARASAALGQDAFDTALAEGRALPLEDALALAASDAGAGTPRGNEPEASA